MKKSQITMHTVGSKRAPEKRRQSLGLALFDNETVTGVYARGERVTVVIVSPQEVRLVHLWPDRLPPKLAELMTAKESLDDLFLREVVSIVTHVNL